MEVLLFVMPPVSFPYSFFDNGRDVETVYLVNVGDVVVVVLAELWRRVVDMEVSLLGGIRNDINNVADMDS